MAKTLAGMIGPSIVYPSVKQIDSMFTSPSVFGSTHWIESAVLRVPGVFDSRVSASADRGTDDLVGDQSQQAGNDSLLIVEDEWANGVLDWLEERRPTLRKATHVCHALATLHAIAAMVEFETRLHVSRSVGQFEFCSGLFFAVAGLLLHISDHAG